MQNTMAFPFEITRNIRDKPALRRTIFLKIQRKITVSGGKMSKCNHNREFITDHLAFTVDG